MRFVTTTAEELTHLREGLQVIESLNEPEDRVEIYFYGLTDNSTLLDAVKDAVEYWSDEQVAAQDVNIAEAVFIFPVSADALYYLTGSGLIIRDGEAVYAGGDEGPRTVNLKMRNDQRGGTRATAGEFKTMALGRDEFSGEDFLLQYGKKTQQPPPEEVERTESAQAVRQQPVTPGREGVAPAKRSSLELDIETWLN